MDSVILNQLNNTEKEVNSEVIRSKRGRRKKLLPTINEVEKSDITERRERPVACVLSGNSNNI